MIQDLQPKHLSLKLEDSYGAVCRWAQYLTRDNQEAEDLCQEVWLHVLVGQKGFHGGAEFSTWLFSITLNSYRDYVRKKLRHPESREADLGRNGFERLQDDYAWRQAQDSSNILVDNVRAALSHINPRHRQLLEWKYNEGRSHAEIACLLGIQKESVWRSVCRARTAFKVAYHSAYANINTKNRLKKVPENKTQR